MGTEQIQQILQKLDTLEEKIDALEKITIRNGGGRAITFQRNDFFQMLYDRGKDRFFWLSDTSKRLVHIFDIILKLATVVTLVVAAMKIGN